MRGQDAIVAMRRAGKRPAIVFLNDFRCPTDWAQWSDSATVCVANDTPESLDLRFLIGLRVSISGASVDRAQRFMRACQEAGCVQVGAGVQALTRGRQETTWCEIWNKEN